MVITPGGDPGGLTRVAIDPLSSSSMTTFVLEASADQRSAWIEGGTSARWQYAAHASPPAMTGAPRAIGAAGAVAAYSGLRTIDVDGGT